MRSGADALRSILALALGTTSVCLAGAARAGAVTYAEQVVADGAIHYWRFEESSTASPAADEIPSAGSQTNNPGSFEGGVTLGLPSAAPPLGLAAEFDGTSGTHVALGTPQHPGDSFSVEAWVLLGPGTGGSTFSIAGRWDGSWRLAFDAVGPDAATLSIRNEVDTLAVASIPDFTRNGWHHVVGTFVGESDGGGGTATIYLDGARGAPVSVGFDLRDHGGDDALWYIGRTGDPTQVSWLGRIDEVAIYPRALSASEIANHIALAHGTTYAEEVVADGAIHYWRFEESSTASPAADEIPSGGGQTNNPGVYQGGVTLGDASAETALGSAARFDGQAGTQIDLGPPQHPGDSMSLETWLWLDPDASSSSFVATAGRWDGSWTLDADVRAPEHMSFAVRNDINGFGSSSSLPFFRDHWHHLVGVFDGASDGGGGLVTSYLDGLEGSSVSIGFDLQDAGGTDGRWYIGTTRDPITGVSWKGLIDEVAIYPYALSTQQVRTHLALSRVNLPEAHGALAMAAGAALLAGMRRRRDRSRETMDDRDSI